MIRSAGKTVKFVTLGCRVNQYETQAIRESLERAGVRELDVTAEPSDIAILNSCTVTHDADKTNRYWIRRLKRENPAAKLVVTGCFAERNRAELEKMSEVNYIFNNQEKGAIAGSILSSGSQEFQNEIPPPEAFLPLTISRHEDHIRANVKIQDGCNRSCSFCKVVLARGPSRSRPLEDIEAEVLRLRDAGYQEIILTGIQLGAYGLDRKKSKEAGSLCEVIKLCAEVEGIQRIRLSSIEPMDVRDPLLETFLNVPKLCPHLHIPLQSGDDEVLKKMNRGYKGQDYVEIVQKIRKRVPNFNLTLDVMVAFPGETEKQFQNTLEVLAAVEPLKCHVFPYSRREGTQAAQMKDVPAEVRRERAQRAITRAGKISETVRGHYIGRTFDVLAEHQNPRTGLWEGQTVNGLRVFFEFPRHVRGCIIPVILTDLFQEGCLGRVLMTSN